MPDTATGKAGLRVEALRRRDAEPHREEKSGIICAALLWLPEYEGAGTVLTYVGVRSEVDTRQVVAQGMEDGKRVAVPWVSPEGLRASFIRSLDDLVPSRFGLLEPAPEHRADPARECRPDEADLFVVPGLAFDRDGGRLGHGRAYYDRLLARARPGAGFVGLAFESQVFERIPMTPTDVRMHVVVTEKAIYGLRPAG